jgi:hypothetical protein
MLTVRFKKRGRLRLSEIGTGQIAEFLDELANKSAREDTAIPAFAAS